MSNHPPATRTVKVAFGDGRGYDVVIGHGVLGETADRIRKLVGAKPWFVVVDDGVPAEIQVALTRDTSARVVRWKSSEAEKSLVIVERLLHQLAADRFERGCPVVALGGGITGDVAGFAAAIYQRGTHWINCPTTLLSM